MSDLITNYTVPTGQVTSGHPVNPASIVDPNANFNGLLAFFQTITNPSTWVRIGLFMMAFLLVIVGFLILIHGNEATAGGVS